MGISRRTQAQPAAHANVVEHLQKPVEFRHGETEPPNACFGTQAIGFPQPRIELPTGFRLLSGQGFLDQVLIGRGLGGVAGGIELMVADGNAREKLEHIAQEPIFASGKFEDEPISGVSDEFHSVALHGRFKAVLMELVYVVFGAFHGFAGEDTAPLPMDLEHVKLRLGFGPAKHPLEYMRHIIHQVYRIVPANHQETRLELVPRIGVLFPLDIRENHRLRCLDHLSRLGEGRGVFNQPGVFIALPRLNGFTLSATS